MGGVTLCRAGRSSNNCFVVVSESSNFFLSNDYSAADRAVRTGGFASLGAGRSNSRISHSSVSGCRNGFGGGCAADRTGLGQHAGLGAGSILGHFACVPAVAGCIDISINVGIAATRAGVGGVTLRRAGRSSNNCFVVVVESSNGFLSSQDSATNRAVRTGGQTGLGAGCCDSSIVHNSVSGCCDVFGLGCAADRAGVGLNTLFGAGSSLGHNACVPAMSRSCNIVAGVGITAN